ncbi:MAG: hypothetical protein JF618_11565 [Leifsonia sp.]|nr:hypothetical protein [Leifsonia sp.]
MAELVDSMLGRQSDRAPRGVADACAKDQITSFGQADPGTWQCWRADFGVATAVDVTQTLIEFDRRAAAAGCTADGGGGLARVLNEYWIPSAGTDPRNSGDVYGPEDLPSGDYDCGDGIRLDLQPDTAEAVEDFQLTGDLPVDASNGFENENAPITLDAVRGLRGDLIMVVTASQAYFSYPK